MCRDALSAPIWSSELGPVAPSLYVVTCTSGIRTLMPIGKRPTDQILRTECNALRTTVAKQDAPLALGFNAARSFRRSELSARRTMSSNG
ncbi:unnamed protein product, partial [Iphiclides podalirius]